MQYSPRTLVYEQEYKDGVDEGVERVQLMMRVSKEEVVGVMKRTRH